MQPDRETVYQAVNTYLAGLLGPSGNNTFAEVSRRLVSFKNLGQANSPSLFQYQKGESPRSVKGIPNLRDFDIELVIYNNFGNESSVIPSTALNALVTAVENALAPNPATAFQQLGVPVSSLLVTGRIEYFEGVLNDWSVAIMPVKIVANY